MKKPAAVFAIVILAAMWGSWFLGKPTSWDKFPGLASMVMYSAIVLLLWVYIVLLDFLVDLKVAHQSKVVKENERLVKRWTRLRDEAQELNDQSQALNAEAEKKLQQAQTTWSLKLHGKHEEPN